MGYSVGAQFFRTSPKSGTAATDGTIRFGLAYRPEKSKWIILDSLDLGLSQRGQTAGSLENWRIVNQMNVNLKTGGRTQISFQHGFKFALDTIDNDRYKGFTDLIAVEGRYNITRKWDAGFRSSLRHSWQSNQADYSSGLSLGYNVMENAWLSAGYNFLGFSDRDFSKANFTAQGPFIQLRLKLNQQGMQDALKWLSGGASLLF
jgi:hypothetical protein